VANKVIPAADIERTCRDVFDVESTTMNAVKQTIDAKD
jgi:hypothetical protein